MKGSSVSAPRWIDHIARAFGARVANVRDIDTNHIMVEVDVPWWSRPWRSRQSILEDVRVETKAAAALARDGLRVSVVRYPWVRNV
jgi:hypothetical protein